MRVRPWLPPVLALVAIASCTYDYDAPFSSQDGGTASGSSGSSGDGGPASEAGPSADAEPSNGCSVDDWKPAVDKVFPVSWFRLDEMEPAPFVGKGKVTMASRGASTTRIAKGAVRAPSQAQHLGSIDFGDVWPQLNGVVGRLSIALWFRAADPQSGEIVLFKKREESTKTVGMNVTLSATGTIALNRTGGPQPLGFEGGRISSTDGWNRWHHLVVQRSSETTRPLLQFYVDGEKKDWDDDLSFSFAPTDAPFRIGPFDGDVDEVLAFDRLLTQSEVYALIDAATSGACAAGQKSVCYGPSAIGACNAALAKWVENCPANQVCVMDNGRPACVADPCK